MKRGFFPLDNGLLDGDQPVQNCLQQTRRESDLSELNLSEYAITATLGLP
jgi:hypothetical protein